MGYGLIPCINTGIFVFTTTTSFMALVLHQLPAQLVLRVKQPEHEASGEVNPLTGRFFSFVIYITFL
jgi:hypothetical protein